MRCDDKSCDVTSKPETPRDVRTGCSHVDIYQNDHLVEEHEKAKLAFDRVCLDEDGGITKCDPKYHINVSNTRENLTTFWATHRCGDGVVTRIVSREDIL
jgi:hypothetical protein